MRLRDKVAIVTGASSGFGRMTAARFAEEGAKVVVADVDGPGAEETGAIVTRTGGEAELVIGDISTMEGARAVVDRAVARFGTVDILVNNAGISQRETSDSWDCAEETWDRILQVNLKSVFVCTKASLPVMLEQGRGSIVSLASIAASCSIGGSAYAASKGGGSIVNIASIAATRAVSGSSYAAAKAGMLGYTHQVAAELAARGVRVNCVSPGYMRTPMSTGERIGLDAAAQDDRVAAFGRLVPMQRAGSVDDIAAAVAYLACDDARYVTGQEIVVDGGYLVG